MSGVETTNQFHATGRKTNPIKFLGTRQHIKLGSRQQAGNSVFFKFNAAGKTPEESLHKCLHYLKNLIAVHYILQNIVFP